MTPTDILLRAFHDELEKLAVSGELVRRATENRLRTMRSAVLSGTKPSRTLGETMHQLGRIKRLAVRPDLKKHRGGLVMDASKMQEGIKRLPSSMYGVDASGA